MKNKKEALAEKVVARSERLQDAIKDKSDMIDICLMDLKIALNALSDEIAKG